MTHKCSKCGKDWECITDMLARHILEEHNYCDHTDQDSICYDCSKLTHPLKTVKDELELELLKLKTMKRSLKNVQN